MLSVVADCAVLCSRCDIRGFGNFSLPDETLLNSLAELTWLVYTFPFLTSVVFFFACAEPKLACLSNGR